MAEVSTVLHDETMYEMMEDRADRGRFAMNIGSTNTTSEVFVETITDDDESDQNESMEEEDTSLGDDHMIDYEDWE